MILQENILLPYLFLLPILLFIPAIFFFFIFLFKYSKTRQKMLGYLTLLFLMYILKNFFQTTLHVSPNETFARNGFIIFRIADMLMLFAFILVIEMFETDVFFSKRIIILTILAFTTIGSYFTNNRITIELETFVFGDIYLVYFKETFNFTNIVHGIFNLIAGFWLFVSIYRSKKYAFNSQQKALINWLLIGLIIGILLPSPIILDVGFIGSTPFLTLIRTFLRDIFGHAGMLIIGIAFYRVIDNPWLLQRQRIHLLMVYSRDGLELFSKNFSQELADDSNLLLAGGFSAITSLFKEATMSAGQIQAILLEDKELWLKNRENFVFALLVDYMTQASQLAFENFVNDFEKHYEKELENFDGEISKFKSAEKIATKYFT